MMVTQVRRGALTLRNICFLGVGVSGFVASSGTKAQMRSGRLLHIDLHSIPKTCCGWFSAPTIYQDRLNASLGHEAIIVSRKGEQNGKDEHEERCRKEQCVFSGQDP